MTRTATWARVGTNISECENVQTALQTAGLDYTVTKSEILLPSGVVIPDKVATIKEETGQYIGVVSKSYQIYQNQDAFEFVDSIPDIKFVKAGETNTGMVYIIGQLPETTVLNDTFAPYVIFQTSHNGRYNVKATICPLRIVCQNQFALSFRTMRNSFDIRHSRQLPSKVAQAQELIQDTARYMAGFTNTAEELALLKISSRDTVYEIIDKFFDGTIELTERQRKNMEEQKDQFMVCYTREDNQNFQGTAWGMINAFSDYITHKKRKETKNSADSAFMSVTFDTEAMNKFMSLVMSDAR